MAPARRGMVAVIARHGRISAREFCRRLQNRWPCRARMPRVRSEAHSAGAWSRRPRLNLGSRSVTRRGPARGEGKRSAPEDNDAGPRCASVCVCVCLSLSLSAPLTSSSQMFALLDAAFCSPTTPGAEGRGTDTYLKKGLGEQVCALKHHAEETCIIVAITDTSPPNAVAFCLHRAASRRTLPVHRRSTTS